MKRLAALLPAAALLAAACAGPESQSDWERSHIKPEAEELKVSPPAYPQPANLVHFRVPGGDDFRFYVDGTTISAGKDGIVRYVLVARSIEGAQNVTFEGLRCRTGEARVYAVGRPDGTWSARPGPWQPGMQRWQRTLQRDYFCRMGQPIRDGAEGVRAIRGEL